MTVGLRVVFSHLFFSKIVLIYTNRDTVVKLAHTASFKNVRLHLLFLFSIWLGFVVDVVFLYRPDLLLLFMCVHFSIPGST